MPPEPIPESSVVPPRQSTTELLRDMARHAVAYARDLGKLAGAEAREKGRHIGTLVVSVAIAGVFGALGFFFLTVALIAAIAYGLNSWGWAAFIVGIGYSIIAALVLLPAVHAVQKGALRFGLTVQRVKQDAQWVKNKLAA